MVCANSSNKDKKDTLSQIAIILERIVGMPFFLCLWKFGLTPFVPCLFFSFVHHLFAHRLYVPIGRTWYSYVYRCFSSGFVNASLAFLWVFSTCFFPSYSSFFFIYLFIICLPLLLHFVVNEHALVLLFIHFGLYTLSVNILVWWRWFERHIFFSFLLCVTYVHCTFCFSVSSVLVWCLISIQIIQIRSL